MNKYRDHHIINTEGQIITQEPYNFIKNFREGLALVSNLEKGKSGFIDKNGTIAILLKYEDASSFSEGLAKVRFASDKYGFIDRLGNQIISCSYSYARSFHNSWAIIYNNGIYNYINKEEQFISKTGFSKCFDFQENFARVKYGGRYGVINSNGDLMFSKKEYQDMHNFSEGLAAVKINGKFGLINMNGDLVIAPIYHSIRPFKDGLAAVSIKGKWGFINNKGETVIPFVFEDTGFQFSEGFCFVSQKNKIGAIDKYGDVRIPFVFDDSMLGRCRLSEFNNGLAFASLDTELGEVNEEGFIVERKDKFNKPEYFLTGFIDYYGKVKVPFIYFYAIEYNDGLAPVYSFDGAGYVDSDGVVKIPLEYEEISPFSDGFSVVSERRK